MKDCKCIKQPIGSYVRLDYESSRGSYGTVSKNYYVRDTDEIIRLKKIAAKLESEFHKMNNRLCKLRSKIQKIRIRKAKEFARAEGKVSITINRW